MRDRERLARRWLWHSFTQTLHVPLSKAEHGVSLVAEELVCGLPVKQLVKYFRHVLVDSPHWFEYVMRWITTFPADQDEKVPCLFFL